tara:strand:- start:5474 stop:6184 length:711 start_codon:yes stop_codon:yes gene_type:complete
MVDFMAKKIPEHIAFRLAQKTKAAEKKTKAAEKKTKAAEKKVKEAEKKVKEAEKKAKAAEEKIQDVEEVADDSGGFDDLDDLDDFDDFDAVEDAPGEESGELEEEPQTGLVSENADDELEDLMKQASSSESSEQRVQRANRFANEGDFDGALEIWKDLTASEAENPENWRGIASVLDQRNLKGDAAKAQTARDHSDRIETQVITDKTGRKMEDIIADLMDDGVLNFSAGSDAKDSE